MIKPIRKITRYPRAGKMHPRPTLDEQYTIDRAGVQQGNVLPDEIENMARLVGYDRAKAVWQLKQRGVQGTLPELCAYDWLEKRRVSFDFQSALMGGRRVQGGAVVDFLIYNLSPNGYYIWRINGDYWHSGLDVEKKDDVQKMRLTALKIGGIPVAAVVDIWESRIYREYPAVFLKAEAGEEMGRM